LLHGYVYANREVAHLWLQQWKLDIIKSVLVKYNYYGNMFLAGLGFILYLFCAIDFQQARTSKGRAIGVPAFYSYVMICDIIFFVLIVMSLRKLVRIRTEVLNVESSRESFRVQAFLAISLASIIASGVTFGTSSMSVLPQDALVNWLVTIQILSSYYYFINVASVLGNRRQSSAKKSDSSKPGTTATPHGILSTRPTQETTASQITPATTA
jgi:hypothetical protein